MLQDYIAPILYTQGELVYSCHQNYKHWVLNFLHSGQHWKKWVTTITEAQRCWSAMGSSLSLGQQCQLLPHLLPYPQFAFEGNFVWILQGDPWGWGFDLTERASVRTWVQIPRTLVSLEVVVSMCSPSAPTGRQAETGESLEIKGLTSWKNAALNKRPVSNKVGVEDTRLSSHLPTYSSHTHRIKTSKIFNRTCFPILYYHAV